MLGGKGRETSHLPNVPTGWAGGLHFSHPNVPSRAAQDDAGAAAVELAVEGRLALLAEEGDGHVGLDVAAAGVRVEVDGDARRDGQGDAAAGGLELRVAARLLRQMRLDRSAGGGGVDRSARLADADRAAGGMRDQVARGALDLDVAAGGPRVQGAVGVAHGDVSARGGERDVR